MVIGLVILALVVLALVVWLIARRRRPQGRQRWTRTDRLALAGIIAGAVVGCLPVALDLFGRQPATSGASAPTVPFVEETVQVEGRSAVETELTANGIRLPRGGFMTFQDVGGVPRTITSRDWNTIVSTSRVPMSVRVVMDSQIETDPTMVRRTQYLADVAGRPLSGRIKAVFPLHVLSGRTVVTPVLFVNGLPDARRITDLAVRVQSKDGRDLLSAHFFGGDNTPVVAANTAYFTYLQWDADAVPDDLTQTDLNSVSTISKIS